MYNFFIRINFVSVVVVPLLILPMVTWANNSSALSCVDVIKKSALFFTHRADEGIDYYLHGSSKKKIRRQILSLTAEPVTFIDKYLVPSGGGPNTNMKNVIQEYLPLFESQLNNYQAQQRMRGQTIDYNAPDPQVLADLKEGYRLSLEERSLSTYESLFDFVEVVTRHTQAVGSHSEQIYMTEIMARLVASNKKMLEVLLSEVFLESGHSEFFDIMRDMHARVNAASDYHMDEPRYIQPHDTHEAGANIGAAVVMIGILVAVLSSVVG